MNAAKKIRRFIEENQNPEQVQVLKDLAAALEMGRAFDLGALYQIDMRYFEVALDLLKDWRFDHHIAARSKLLEQLLTEIAPDLQVSVNAAASTAAESTEPASPPAAEAAPSEEVLAETSSTAEASTAPAAKPTRRRTSKASTSEEG
ncbi:MAG: hypothetical protein JO338_12210 [Aquitalea sp.]|nr:hypothetical protein [Aquitalea sp.]